ncbi:GIY-YIG nuclease family protein [Oharaeibacter diazotrophicus]|uniref:Putative endonuclease n=1 Tax=Oharaeibacter diazotrophicus TaxID=1920512 RepID=A0A4R6R9N4_9HYPH|nr:GIY-YIG nuclease family protein [Oharaeibacter diazotrophicus]TDP82644.1 putative endonuclease [Oharaeibacter diazotrophicus]BBE72592.1 GIY-YIG nuclease superfamily protein [Pleomorphomonas sp. SM30]GLS76624.1 excinuclease ABC subunit C [Oharaeibacter diazotrophicus]
MKSGTVYIVTNRPNGILYTGVTSDLVGRIFEHREGLIDGFTKRYGCTRLVWYEDHEEIGDAIWRERRIKTWNRAWKVRLILGLNPEWRDLYAEVAGMVEGR